MLDQLQKGINMLLYVWFEDIFKSFAIHWATLGRGYGSLNLFKIFCLLHVKLSVSNTYSLYVYFHYVAIEK